MRQSDIAVKLEVPIKIYRIREKTEMKVKKTLAEIDPEAHEKALEAFRKGDKHLLREIISKAVKKWVESQGGKLLAAVEVNGDLELYIKAPE